MNTFKQNELNRAINKVEQLGTLIDYAYRWETDRHLIMVVLVKRTYDWVTWKVSQYVNEPTCINYGNYINDTIKARADFNKRDYEYIGNDAIYKPDTPTDIMDEISLLADSVAMQGERLDTLAKALLALADGLQGNKEALGVLSDSIDSMGADILTQANILSERRDNNFYDLEQKDAPDFSASYDTY